MFFNFLRGEFFPKNLPSLQLWLDASDISTITKDVSDLVSQWNDKSGRANHAVQGTGANQGTWTANQINGKAAIVLDNDDYLSIADNASLDFDGGTGSTIFMVVNFDGYINQGSGFNVLLGKGSCNLASATYNIQSNSGNEFWFQSGNNEINLNTGGTINGAAHLLTAIMDNAATDSYTWRDGLTKTTNSTATVASDNSGALIIGGDTGAVRYAAGKYAEIIIYNRPLSDAERLQVESYLSRKWGL